MHYLTIIATIVGEVMAVLAVIIPVFASIKKLKTGMKCQLRSDMLSTYYRHAETKEIRQYELENFVALYEAYKALGGNSFMDKIHEEVMGWEVTT